jgi:ATP-binding cassette subfamily B protein
VSLADEKSKPVLTDLSFTIKAGETLAILGSTGSGKSTVMHLLLRLYDYNAGSIKINGVELREIDKKHLRERVGIVLQEPFLYSKTIIENIRMARFDAGDEDIYESTRTAAVHDVISGFEHGYDTIVGEKGVTLSGGQKQRVAIARTLIKNSDILIFDDSLSAVDTETDSQIRAALRERQAGVTTFIISQRITTLMEADRIFIIENGRLSDAGTHEELIGRDGLYSRIWNIQNTLEEDFADAIE